MPVIVILVLILLVLILVISNIKICLLYTSP